MDLLGTLTAVRSASTSSSPFRGDPTTVELARDAPKVVEFFYGTPSRQLVCRGMMPGPGLLAGGIRREARAAAKAGCDFIVAQGIEAGGICAVEPALATCCP